MSHKAVAESDDLPDVSTRQAREANTHKPKHHAHMRTEETKHSGGKWSEGPRAKIFRTGS